MPTIHPSAVVSDKASIADSAIIGPYCIVGEGVILAEDVELKSHVVIEGNTHVGKETVIYSFAVIGTPSQDKKFKEGQETKLIIGENNVIREHVTINPGHTEPERSTQLGNNCLLMVGAHIAHDCQVGDNVIMANNATLGGHVTVGNNAILGGLSAVHQFVRIGNFAIIGGMSGVENDVIPYGSVKGERAKLSGVNIIGLKRNGFSRSQIQSIREAYDALFGPNGPLSDRLKQVANDYQNEDVINSIVDFIRQESSRGICQPGL